MTQTLPMRSWLFAPGDSEKKMTKAMEGAADIVLIDLEDAVAPESKAAARPMVHDFIKAHTEQKARLWVRINPFDGPHTLLDLAAIMPAAPGSRSSITACPRSRSRTGSRKARPR